MRYVICFLVWFMSLSAVYADGVSSPLEDPTVAAPLKAATWSNGNASEGRQQPPLRATSAAVDKSANSSLTRLYDGVSHSVTDAQSGIAWEHVAVAGGLLIAMFIAGN